MPGGFSLGAKVSSGQFNQLDVDHANALDKSSAGDQLQGIVTMTLGAQVQASVFAGVKSSVVGGIAFGGGTADWGAFVDSSNNPQSRTVVRWRPLQALAIASGWSATGGAIGFLLSPASTTPQGIILSDLYQGATLTSISIMFSFASTVPGTQPTNQMKISVLRFPMGASAGLQQTLAAGDPLSPPSMTLSAATQVFQYNCTQNNVIDNSQYTYGLLITDNNGGSAVPLVYSGTQRVYTSITDLRPQ